MLSSVFSKAVADRSKGTAVAVALVVFYGGVAIAMYNALGDTMTDLFDAMPPALKAMYGVNDGTPVGMAVGAIYAIIAPAVILVSTIGGGTNAAVGEEAKGTLDLLLSNPLSRGAIALSKAAVVVLSGLAISLATWGGVAASLVLVGDDIGDLDLFAVTVMMFGFGLLMGFFAMAVGAWTGKPSLGIGVATGVAVASWLMTTVLAVNESFATISKFTPWYLYDGNDPLANGIAPWSLAIALGGAVVFAVLTPIGLGRRDLKG